MTDPDPQTPSAPPPAPLIDHEPARVPPPAQKTVRRGGTPVLLTLILFAGLAGGLYWVWTNPQPRPGGDSPGEAAEIAALSSKMDAQSQAGQQSLQPVQAKLSELGTQIEQLTARVAKLEQAPSPAPAEPAAPPADTQALSGELEQLKTRLASLESKPQTAEPSLQVAPPAPDHAALDAVAAQAKSDTQAQVAALAQRLDEALAQQKTDREHEAEADKTAIEQLGGRVDHVEQGAGAVVGEANRNAAAIKTDLRVQQAATALAAGQPLGDIQGAPPALAAYASKAPPTEAALRADFPAIADAILAASRPEAENRSFLDRALARMQQSVTIRRGDHVIVGDPAAGVVERARQDVANDDLPGTVTALSGLTGPAAQAASDWTGRAKALLAARAALADLAAHR